MSEDKDAQAGDPEQGLGEATTEMPRDKKSPAGSDQGLGEATTEMPRNLKGGAAPEQGLGEATTEMPRDLKAALAGGAAEQGPEEATTEIPGDMRAALANLTSGGAAGEPGAAKPAAPAGRAQLGRPAGEPVAPPSLVVAPVMTKDAQPVADGSRLNTGRLKAGFGIRETAQDRARAKVRAKVKGEQVEEQKRSPVMMVALIGIVLLLPIVIFYDPNAGGEDSAAQNKALLTSYESYLKARKDPNVDVPKRLKEVDERLTYIAWAERHAHPEERKRRLRELLIMDADRTSPIHQYAAARLRE